MPPALPSALWVLQDKGTWLRLEGYLGCGDQGPIWGH